MLIEVLDTHRQCQSQVRLLDSGTTCKIGRGLSCDIVLNDVYAASEHTLLTLRDDGRVSVADLSSRNGTRVNGQRCNAAAITIEGGELIIGRTHVRVRTVHTPSPPEKLFRRDLVQRHRTLFAVLGLALTIGYAAFGAWQEAPEQMARNVFIAVLGASTAMGVWIGLWALITRVNHGAWTLRTHIAIAANTTALVLWSSLAFDVAAFATQWSGLATLGGIIVVGVTLGGLYLHLRRATHMTQRVAAVIAVAIPLALGGTAAWIVDQGSARNVNHLALGADVYPPQVRIAPPRELNEYLTHTNELKRAANRNRQASLAAMPIEEAQK
jgi:hypothetical protein